MVLEKTLESLLDCKEIQPVHPKGDLVIIDDVLNLNGYTLTVKGDMVLTAGQLYVNGGKLIVEKDLRMQSRVAEDDETYTYSKGLGRLVMTNAKDEVLVKGPRDTCPLSCLILAS